METIKLPSVPPKKMRRGMLPDDIFEVAQNDYQAVMQQIAAQEIAQQVAIGNKPTNLIVDNRKNGRIADVKFSVVAFFVDAAIMLAALNDVWEELHRLGAEDTGYAEQNYQVWAQNGRDKPRYAGTSPAAISADAINPSTGLFVVGPMVSYTRKYRWLRDGGVSRKFKASRRTELKGLKVKDKPRVAVSIQEEAARRVARRYRPLSVKESWVSVADLNPGGRHGVTRVPGVVVRRKPKGAI